MRGGPDSRVVHCCRSRAVWELFRKFICFGNLPRPKESFHKNALTLLMAFWKWSGGGALELSWISFGNFEALVLINIMIWSWNILFDMPKLWQMYPRSIPIPYSSQTTNQFYNNANLRIVAKNFHTFKLSKFGFSNLVLLVAGSWPGHGLLARLPSFAPRQRLAWCHRGRWRHRAYECDARTRGL